LGPQIPAEAYWPTMTLRERERERERERGREGDRARVGAE